MPFFIFNSKEPLKQLPETNCYKNLPVHEIDILQKCDFAGFFYSLIVCRLKFILFKMKLFFYSDQKVPTVYRKYFCINKYFKNILVVEWGFYDDLIVNEEVPHDVFHFSADLDYVRPYSIPEYDCSDNDFLQSIYKSRYSRIIYRSLLSNPPLKLSPRFFFNFFVLMPTTVSGYTDTSPFSSDFRHLKPPMQTTVPILFELFLLKFYFCSFLFSTSLSQIYEFYSLGTLKSLVLRLYSI